MIRSGLRPYTLEVTPYRGGLIELVKQLGGAFALRPHAKEDTGLATNVAAKAEETQDPDKPFVSTDDLVTLFGFTKPLAPRYYEIEKYSGVDQVQGAHIFLEPGSPQPGTRPANQGQGRPGGGGGGLQGPNQRGPGMPSGGQPPGGQPPAPRPPAGQQPPQGGNRQAAITGTVDSHLLASGWRRVNVESGGASGMAAGNRGFGGLSSGGMGGMSSLARSGGGLGGPAGMARMGGGMGVYSADCPNCGRKR
jgi:hypothetical protein